MTTEPFPSLYEGQDRLRPLNGEKRVQLQQRRRKSSGLGGEIRAGDTGVPAIATMAMRGQSPGILRVCRAFLPTVLLVPIWRGAG